MSTKTIMILCVALFAVVHSMPASKQEAPAEGMKTAETIYSWAPSAMLGYRSAYTMPYAFRSAAIPAYYTGLNYESPMEYSSILDDDCL